MSFRTVASKRKTDTEALEASYQTREGGCSLSHAMWPPCCYGCVMLKTGRVYAHDVVNLRFIAFAFFHNVPHVVIEMIVLFSTTEHADPVLYQATKVALWSSGVVALLNVFRAGFMVLAEPYMCDTFQAGRTLRLAEA